MNNICFFAFNPLSAGDVNSHHDNNKFALWKVRIYADEKPIFFNFDRYKSCKGELMPKLLYSGHLADNIIFLDLRCKGNTCIFHYRFL